jgi:hypothetical protein
MRNTFMDINSTVGFSSLSLSKKKKSTKKNGHTEIKKIREKQNQMMCDYILFIF